MSTPLTRSQARAWTIAAQAGALVCVLGVIAIGVGGLPEHRVGASLEIARANAQAFQPPVLGTAPEETANAMPSDDIDAEGVAQRFALLDNAPKPVVLSNDDEQNDARTLEVEPEPPSVDDANIIRRVRYIGFINDARQQHAFIRIDGKQRVVKNGATALAADEALPDLEVLRITPSYIRLRDPENGAEANVRLASRTGASVTMINGDDVVVAEVPDQNDSLLTPEEEAYIESLPPRMQPGARRRLEREKRGLPPENPNPKPIPEALVKIRGNMNSNARGVEVQRRRNQRNND